MTINIGSTALDQRKRLDENKSLLQTLNIQRDDLRKKCEDMVSDDRSFDDSDNEKFNKLVAKIALQDSDISKISNQFTLDKMDSVLNGVSTHARTPEKDKLSDSEELYRSLSIFIRTMAKNRTSANMSANPFHPQNKNWVHRYVGGDSAGGNYKFNFTNLAMTKEGDAAGVGKTGDTSSAGNYVPELFTRITNIMKSFGGARQFARVSTSTNGRDKQFEVSDQTSKVGEINGMSIPSGGNATAEAPNPMVTLTMPINTISTKPQEIAIESLVDAETDLQGNVIQGAIMPVYRTAENLYVNGITVSGVIGDGIIEKSKVSLTAAATTTVTWEELNELTKSIDKAYLDGYQYLNMFAEDDGSSPGVTGFLMHQNTFGVVERIKDTDNRPIFLPSLMVSGDRRLFGYPIIECNDVPVLAAGSKSIVFGSGNAFRIVDVYDAASGLRFWNDSPFGRSNHVAWQYFLRTGSRMTGGMKTATGTSEAIGVIQQAAS